MHRVGGLRSHVTRYVGDRTKLVEGPLQLRLKMEIRGGFALPLYHSIALLQATHYR